MYISVTLWLDIFLSEDDTLDSTEFYKIEMAYFWKQLVLG